MLKFMFYIAMFVSMFKGVWTVPNAVVGFYFEVVVDVLCVLCVTCWWCLGRKDKSYGAKRQEMWGKKMRALMCVVFVGAIALHTWRRQGIML